VCCAADHQDHLDHGEYREYYDEGLYSDAASQDPLPPPPPARVGGDTFMRAETSESRGMESVVSHGTSQQSEKRRLHMIISRAEKNLEENYTSDAATSNLVSPREEEGGEWVDERGGGMDEGGEWVDERERGRLADGEWEGMEERTHRPSLPSMHEQERYAADDIDGLSLPLSLSLSLSIKNLRRSMCVDTHSM
jgi:hypothetical protein